MAVSIVALVVAMGGTATAAGMYITQSSQLKNGVVSGPKIKSGAVGDTKLATGAVGARQLKKGAVSSDNLNGALKAALANQGFASSEVVRKDGPTQDSAGNQTVATMSQLPAGTYAIFANTTIGPTPADADNGLLDTLLKSNHTADFDCTLNAGGDTDRAAGVFASVGAEFPDTVNLQITRTLAAPADVVVTCESGIAWKAADTSIIALKLPASQRVDVTG